MSASIVRKALEISAASESGSVLKIKKNKTDKLKAKRKKTSVEKIAKRNLRLLKALDSSKPKKIVKKVSVPQPQPTKKKNKKAREEDPNKTAFTEEDFAKFEQEYFVSQ